MSTRVPSSFLRDGVVALIVTAAASGACATMWWLGLALGAGGSACVLATVVALSLGRRSFASRREFVRSAALLPVVGLAAALVGWLLVTVPPLGAALFVAGMSIPIWMRRFGSRAARRAGLIALPLTAVLVAPVAPGPGVPAWLTVVLVLLAGIVAVLWVALGREIVRLIPGGRPAQEAPAAPPPARTSGTGRRLPASTRMALQMAVALTTAFAVGWLLFPDHAMWVVLTAFLVCSGNRGRADVLHKSALRVIGALAGTIGAVAVVSVAPNAAGIGVVVVIFAALFVGTWLRPVSYAYWAVAVTLVLALLQELTGTAGIVSTAGVLAERLLAIVVGAALGIAASWFVLPVRSIDVLRRRLSELLVALGGVVAAPDPTSPDPSGTRRDRLAAFHAALARVEQLAPAHRAARLVAGRRARASDCIEAAIALGPALDDRLSTPSARAGADLRLAIGRTRRSLAAPTDLGRVQEALVALAEELRAP